MRPHFSFRPAALAAAIGAAALLATACGGGGGGSSTDKRDVSSVKVAGDSLADSGTFAGTAGNGRIFSVQGSAAEPNVLWTERIAANSYKTASLCNYYRATGSSTFTVNNAACTSYAIGGGRINNLAGLGPESQLSIIKQLRDLGDRGYAANELLLVDGGGNDAADLVGAYLKAASDSGVTYAALLATVLSGQTVATTLAQPNGAVTVGTLYMTKLADNFYDAIQTRALDKGATRVAVLNIPGITNTPRFQAVLDQIAAASGGGSAGATARAQSKAVFDGWVMAFNAELLSRAGTDKRVVVVDFYGSFNEQLANPSKYSITNTTKPACPSTGIGSDGLPNYNFQTCTATALSASPPVGVTNPNWWTTYLFSDGFHPTPLGHELLANTVAAALQQAGWL